MILREQLILVCFISVCFLFFSVAGACEVALNFVNVLLFPLALASLILIIIIITDDFGW